MPKPEPVNLTCNRCSFSMDLYFATTAMCSCSIWLLFGGKYRRVNRGFTTVMTIPATEAESILTKQAGVLVRIGDGDE